MRNSSADRDLTARAVTEPGGCSPTASSPGACRSGTARSTRCSPTCATATASPRRSSATSSPPGSSPGFVTQLALARLADRGYAPMLVRGGILLAMARDDRQRGGHRVLGVPLARLLLGLGSGAVGPAIRRIVITREPDAVGANLGRLAAFDVAGFMLGPLVAAVVAEAFGIRAPVRVPRRGVRRRVRARVPPRSHRRRRAGRTPARAARAARATRDPGHARRVHRVLPDRRHVRGDLGGAAARPRRRDVAHRPHAVAVHAAR